MRNDRRHSALGIVLLASLVLLASAGLPAATDPQTVAERRRIDAVRTALERLPYYGVFDFLSFSIDRGTVTLMGYAYATGLRSDAEQAVKRAGGVDDVVNKVETLPASPNDDRIRRATFYNIYTDDFLSRYSSGGAAGAASALRDSGGAPGMQPFGSYPIHIIVKGGRTRLEGVVASESDKQIAGLRAREVPGVFGVENAVQIEGKTGGRSR